MNFARPRAIGEVEHMLDAIVWGWHNGTMNAEGMLDVLYGKKNPCGRLPMTVLRNVGQIPMYYNAPNTARKVNAYYGEGKSYYDMKSSPAFPFGYGLSYTEFAYSSPEADRTEISLADIENGESIKVTATVRNIGKLAGKRGNPVLCPRSLCSHDAPAQTACRIHKARNRCRRRIHCRI